MQSIYNTLAVDGDCPEWSLNMSVTATQTKVLNIIQPAAAVNGAAFVTAEVDSRAWEYLEVIVTLGATDVAATTLELQESSTSGSGFTAIVGTRFGTDANTAGITSVLPSATDDGKTFSIQVDLRGRERFLDLSMVAASGTAGMFASAIGILSRGHETPTTAASRGLSQSLRV